MSELFRQLLHRFLIISASVMAGAALLAYFILPAQMPAILTAYLLSSIFVGSNFAVLKNIRKKSHESFYRRFLITMSLRLLLVLVAIVAVLAWSGFHQIYFTVSFIISYILHSVIEIIAIEKLLQKQ